MSAQLEKWHFNVDQYYRLAEVGVLKPDDRVELIEGEIVKMSPIGSPHAACVAKCINVFTKGRNLVVTLWVQNPVRLSDFSEPVPDVALLKPRDDFYAEHLPTSEDVLLIIEVSDSTILSDRNVKVPLYARAGIPEAWLVNLPKKMIEVYYDVVESRYRKCLKVKRGEVLISPTVPGLSLKVSEIIG
jgi:Uma2 family endonuclease